MNVNVEGDQVNNKVTYDQVSSEIKFVWSFAKELADTYRQNITLKKKADGTPVALEASQFTYTETSNGAGLVLDLSGTDLATGTSYILSIASGLEALDETTLGKNYNWEFKILSGDYTIKAIVDGGGHKVILKNDGTVWSWGSNYNGQLGDGTRTNRDKPVKAAGLDNVIDIAAGTGYGAPGISKGEGGFTVALKDDGTVWSWGNNGWGQLGHPDSLVPQQIPGLTGIKAVSAIYRNTIAIREDGTAWTSSHLYTDDNVVQWRESSSDYSIGSNFIAAAVGGDGCVGSSKKIEGGSLNHYHHYLALKDDGTVWGWNFNRFGQLGFNYQELEGDENKAYSFSPVKAEIVHDIAAICAGGDRSLALKKDGTVWTWGDDHATPIQVDGLSEIIAIDTSKTNGGTCLALKQDGTVWVWRLIRGDTKTLESYPGQNTTPVQVSGLGGVVAFTANDSGGIAARNDGTLWQINLDGTCSQLNINIVADTEAPTWPDDSAITLTDVAETGLCLNWTLPDNSETITQYAVYVNGDIYARVGGDTTACFISGLTCGETYTFKIEAGDASGNWSTDGPTLTKTMEELTWPAFPKMGKAAIGSNFMVAVRDDGTVWAWGINDRGQLGVRSETCSHSAVPKQIPGLSDVIAVTAGENFSVALKNDGTVWAWGDNNYGQMGDGRTPTYSSGYSDWIIPDYPYTSTPSQVVGLNGITAIAAGRYHCLALKNDGTVWAWGDDRSAQLGDAQNPQWMIHGPYQTTPLQVPNLSGIVSISAGADISMVLRDDGTAWVWGDGINNRWPVSTDVLGVKAIAAGGTNRYVCLDEEGNIHSGSDGNINGLSNVKSVAYGGYAIGKKNENDRNHFIVLKDDGTVWTSGDNEHGQLGNGTNYINNGMVQVQGLCDVVAVYAGPYNCAVLCNGGTIITWGDNTYGQIGDGSQVMRYTPTASQMTITAPVLATPPTLNADTTDNTMGKAIDINFADDADWRAAIKDIIIDGNSIKGQYTITYGNININAEIFNEVRNYNIVVKAQGYSDASVTQTILNGQDAAGHIVIFQKPFKSFNGPTGGVGIDGEFKVGFSEQVLPESLNIVLNKIGITENLEGEKEPVEFTYELNQNKVLSIKTKEKLGYGTYYELVLPAGIKDIKGNISENDAKVVFYTRSFKQPVYKMTQGGKEVSRIVPGQSYQLTATLENCSDRSQTVDAILQLRGGKGAREKHGGDVLAQLNKMVTVGSRQTTDVTLEFTVPVDIDSSVIYGDIYVWEKDGAHASAEPVHFSCPVD